MSIRKLYTQSEYKEPVNRTERREKEREKNERQPLSTMPHITLSSHFARKCCGRVRAIAFNVLSLLSSSENERPICIQRARSVGM